MSVWGGNRGTYVALWLAAGCAVAGCGAGPEPVEMPEVILPSCDEGAQCGRGRCQMVDGAAVCSCARGWARAAAHVCVELHQRTACHGTDCEGVAGCTTPEHCPAGSVCERLTGRCLSREAIDLARVAQPRGTAGTGDFCYVRGEASVRGCAAATVADHCAEGLHCVPTGALEHNVVCGYPQRLPGVCRPTCDPDAPFCELGGGCMFVRGSGGVCMPLGFTDDGCGEALCRPGESCLLGGEVGGAAHGECRVPCEAGDRCPEGTGECRPENEEYAGATYCG